MKKFFEDFPQPGGQKIGFIVLIIGSMLFFAKGIVENNIRILNCIFLVFILGLFCLRITPGVIALLVFLPFMAFIRRAIYFFEPYVGYDPILLISPILTVFMFGYVFIFHGEKLIKYTKENKLLRYISYFVILMLLQMFNPLQGGLAVGFAGAIYWLIPFLWFYFGFFISRKNMHSIFCILIIIGVITAFYGIHQTQYGLLPIEEYWVEHGGQFGIYVPGRFMKIFSTFANPTELSRYLMIAWAIIFIFLFKRPSLWFLWIGGMIILTFSIFMTSVRSTIFLLFTFVGIFIGVKIGNWRKALVANLLFLGLVFWGTSKIPLPSVEIPPSTIEEAHMAHLAKGIRDPFAEESTIWTRIYSFKSALKELSSNPFGYGLGVTTLSSIRFAGTHMGKTMEVFHCRIATSLGILGVILYLLIMYWTIKMSISLVMRDSNTYLVPATLAIWFTIIIDTGLYSIGPFICLLWGWIAKEWTFVQMEREALTSLKEK